MKTKLILFLLFFSFSLTHAQDKKDPSKTEKPQTQEFLKMPEPIQFVKPNYPAEAQKAKITGSVFVQVLVGLDGKAKEIKIIKSDNQIFNQPAINAIKKMVFTPGITKDNKVVEGWITIPFKFSLNDNKAGKKPTK